MNFVNATPHAIVLNDGRSFPPSGFVARVATSFEEAGEVGGVTTYRSVTGAVTGLPPVAEDTAFIVSAMVLEAARGSRHDLVAPSTGHASTVRNAAGHIVSVGGFVT